MKSSLTRRLLGVSALLLLAFIGGTGMVLERAFVNSLDAAQRDRLLGMVYTVLAAARMEAAGLSIPAQLPESRLATPGSGLYVFVRGQQGSWASPSLTGIDFSPQQNLPPGEHFFRHISIGGDEAALLAYGLAWEQADMERRFTVYVAEEMSAYQAQLWSFRRTLWGWLGVLAVGLVLLQLSVLRWSLAPLRRVAVDLKHIRAGKAERLSGRYPIEITPLADSLNALVDSERQRVQRYRDTLGNLAHSLKTPLAVLRGNPALAADQEAQEQLSRIDAAVDYQLRRAAASSTAVLAPPLPVAPAAERILASLSKVYAAKNLTLERALEADASFHGSEGDLLELLGNLLDNACKWAKGRVRVSATQRDGLVLTVEDDGPGIAAELSEAVQQRGRRADERVAGQGIGLAVVREIVDVRRGWLLIDRSEKLGGARVTIHLPAM